MYPIMRGVAVAAALPLLAITTPAQATVTPAAPAGSAGWHVVASYCSGSGDVCFGIKRKGDQVRFRLDSFVDFGPVEFCVRKLPAGDYVCHTRQLQPQKHDLYKASIRWNNHYPSGGHRKREVSFAGYPDTLKFRP